MMADVINDTALSCMARFIMLWILRNPSEAINPDAIAAENHITVKMVKALLAELAQPEHGYLVAPQRVNDPVKAGRFTWTPYTLNPSYGQPSHGAPEDGETVDGGGAQDDAPVVVRAENPSVDFPCMDISAHGLSNALEYVRAAGDKESLSLKTKKSVLSGNDIQTNRQTNSLRPTDKSKSAPVKQNDLLDDLEAKPPEVQNLATTALARAMGMSEPPKVVRDAYFERTTYPPGNADSGALVRMVAKHGDEFVIRQIKTVKLTDDNGNRVQNIARFIETALQNHVDKGLPIETFTWDTTKRGKLNSKPGIKPRKEKDPLGDAVFSDDGQLVGWR